MNDNKGSILTREKTEKILKPQGYTVSDFSLSSECDDCTFVTVEDKNGNSYSARVLVTEDRRLHSCFIKECEQVYKLCSSGHKNIVPVLKFGTSGNSSYCILPEMDYGNSIEMLKTDTAFSEAEIVRIVIEILNGLFNASNFKLRHKNFTPDSVYLLQGNEIQINMLTLQSFRSQLILTDDEDRTEYAKYLIPGIDLTNSSELEISNCYTCAVILYNLLCGVEPYTGSSAEEIYEKRKYPPKPVSEYRLNVDPELQKIVTHYLLASVPGSKLSDNITIASFCDALNSLSDLNESRILVSHSENGYQSDQYEGDNSMCGFSKKAAQYVKDYTEALNIFAPLSGENELYPSDAEFSRLLNSHLKPIRNSGTNSVPVAGDTYYKRRGKGGFGSVFLRKLNDKKCACKMSIINSYQDMARQYAEGAVNELFFIDYISEQCSRDICGYSATPVFYREHNVYNSEAEKNFSHKLIDVYKANLTEHIRNADSREEPILSDGYIRSFDVFLNGLRFDMEYGLPYNDYLIWFNLHDDEYISRHQLKAVRAAVSAMYELHKLGIGHRDIKPENMLVLRRINSEGEPYYTVVFTDFNSAVFLGNKKKCYVEHPEIMTAEYADPVYAANMKPGEYNVEKADIYSLCVTLYRLVERCGVVSWKKTDNLFDNNPADILESTHIIKHTNDGQEINEYHYWHLPEPAHCTDKRLAALIMKGLSENPDDRPTAAQMLAAIDKMICDKEEGKSVIYTSTDDRCKKKRLQQK